MRRFSSYGPIHPEHHYHAPRKNLIQKTYSQLMGENPTTCGNFLTVWAPRQCGKTWLMQQILFKLRKNPHFDVLKINLEHLKYEENPAVIISTIAKEIGEGLNKDFSGIDTQAKFQEIFKNGTLQKPLEQKRYLLHAVALIGVRSVLGIENTKGSPFNIQRSVHIPNLTLEEVEEMFQWYQKESGQTVERDVVQKLYKETRGQPGLTCWLAELLTEGIENYPNDISKPLRLRQFETIYPVAVDILPNNNIINIISKADSAPYRETVLTLFNTSAPIKFRFDKKEINYLYMNGVIEPETDPSGSRVRFASPFVQKRLFNYFSGEIFNDMGQLVDSFLNVKEIVSPAGLDIPYILELYQSYLDRNKDWLFKNAPRRSDMRVYEAVFHFNLYTFIDELLRGKNSRVYPEFPTGNGKIDLLIDCNNRIYGIELKSFTDQSGYRRSLEQAAQYAAQLQLKDIYLVSYAESIDKESKKKFETVYQHPESKVTVHPIFIQTGRP